MDSGNTNQHNEEQKQEVAQAPGNQPSNPVTSSRVIRFIEEVTISELQRGADVVNQSNNRVTSSRVFRAIEDTRLSELQRGADAANPEMQFEDAALPDSSSEEENEDTRRRIGTRQILPQAGDESNVPAQRTNQSFHSYSGRRDQIQQEQKQNRMQVDESGPIRINQPIQAADQVEEPLHHEYPLQKTEMPSKRTNNVVTSSRVLRFMQETRLNDLQRGADAANCEIEDCRLPDSDEEEEEENNKDIRRRYNTRPILGHTDDEEPNKLHINESGPRRILRSADQEIPASGQLTQADYQDNKETPSLQQSNPVTSSRVLRFMEEVNTSKLLDLANCEIEDAALLVSSEEEEDEEFIRRHGTRQILPQADDDQPYSGRRELNQQEGPDDEGNRI